MSAVFRTLVGNDLRLFFSDKRAMIATIFVPIMLASFFAMIFGGGGSGKKAVIAVLIADNDQSAVSQKIIAGLKTDESFKVSPASELAAREAVGKGKVSVALVIPKDFGKLSASAIFNPTAPRPKLTFLYDPAHNADLQLARGLMTQQVMQVVSQEAFSPGESASSGMGMSNPCEMESEAVVAKNSSKPKDASGGKAGATHVFIGMGVQGLLFFAIDLAIGMVRDRRLGLWKRLRAAPLSRLQLLGSRWIASTIIGLVVLSSVLAFGAVFYGIRVSGSVLGLAKKGFSCTCRVIAIDSRNSTIRTRYRAWQSPAVSTGTRNSKSSYDEYGWARRRS